MRVSVYFIHKYSVKTCIREPGNQDHTNMIRKYLVKNSAGAQAPPMRSRGISSLNVITTHHLLS